MEIESLQAPSLLPMQKSSLDLTGDCLLEGCSQCDSSGRKQLRYTDPAPVFLPKFHTRLWTRLEQELKDCGQRGKDSAHWRQVLHLHWSSLWYSWCWLPFLMETLPRVQQHKRYERTAWTVGRKGMAWCRKDVKVSNIPKNRDVLKKRGWAKLNGKQKI